jgi:hypothetical protein
MRYGIYHRKLIREAYEEAKRDIKLMASRIARRLELKEDDAKALRPDNFSLREIAEGLGGDTRPGSDQPIFSEAVTASQFSTLVGTLLSTQVMKAYNEAAKVADQLVTKFQSTQEVDRVPGAYLTGTLEDVSEGGEYPHTADVEEKYVTIGHGKRGLILDVTDEAVRFDRTGLVMDRASQLGRRMARDRESRIISVIQDLTNYKAWYPSGAQSDLYANAAGAGNDHAYDNLVTDVLADYTDLNALYLLLRLMKDENGDPINVMPTTLLVPVTLELTATRIINNEILPGGTNNERNPFANRFGIISTPDLDTQSTTQWYLGDFKSAFKEKVVIPPQVMSRRYGDNNEDAWRRDIVASFKVRYDSQVRAVDYVYVGKSSGG